MLTLSYVNNLTMMDKLRISGLKCLLQAPFIAGLMSKGLGFCHIIHVEWEDQQVCTLVLHFSMVHVQMAHFTCQQYIQHETFFPGKKYFSLYYPLFIHP